MMTYSIIVITDSIIDSIDSIEVLLCVIMTLFY